jgi:hypothetical protein
LQTVRLRSIIEDLEAWWINTPIRRLTRTYQMNDATIRYTTGYSFFRDEPNETLVFVRGDSMWAGELQVNDLKHSSLPRGLFIVQQPGYTQVRWYKNRKKQVCMQVKYSWRDRVKA